MDRFLVHDHADTSTAAVAARDELREYPELLQELLHARGIVTRDEAEKFLNPDYVRDTHDPFLMKDMEKVVDRLVRALNTGEKIVIYSDYDADGIPGAVALHDLFRKIGFENFENYIPHRHDEGFGLNVDAVQQFAEAGANLVISIDCGIADIEPARLARELGLDLIITDHHEPPPVMPEAFAILNPKQVGCEYPEKMLCGAGVIFKLIQAVLARKAKLVNFPAATQIKEGWEKWLLDMVGLATLSDMVPLRGENRALAFYGLKVLRVSPRVGLMKLIRQAGSMQRHITEDDIGFTITPRINAASRMGIPMEAFKLLSTKDEIEAGMLATSLDKKNDERKGLVASMARDINRRIEERARTEALREVIVMGNPDWRPSLLGLVANNLKDDHGRPVFLWGREGGKVIKGSCRSDGSASVVEIMESVRETFITFGGHAFSGGFSLEQDNVHALEDRLVEAYKKIVAAAAGEDGKIRERQTIDKTLPLSAVSWQTWKIVERLGPFGTGNPKPVFLFDNARVAELKQFGKEKNHLELILEKEKPDEFTDAKSNRVSAIKFFSRPEQLSYAPRAGESVRLIATLEKSMFRNFPELRLRIIDVLAKE